MQQRLAESLLNKVLAWDEDDFTREIPRLLAIARSKYDQYQQYRPGMRFIESLAAWLGQFETLPERKTAYEFVLNRLVYFSAEEMFHLVQSAFPDNIRPRMAEIVASEIDVPEFMVAKIYSSREYMALSIRTLYLGLSDGSQIGLLRRLNPGVIKHEHTLISYEPPTSAKADKMRKSHLAEALEGELGPEHGEELTFRHLVLVDDFTASGVSFVRKETTEEGDEWSGKLVRVLKWIVSDCYVGLLSKNGLHITVVYYVATRDALNRIRIQGELFCKENGLDASLDVRAVQVLESSLKVEAEPGTALADLLQTYVEPKSLINEHWEKGIHDRPYLGYNECALPVIIFHNTPNNSLPILWFASREEEEPKGARIPLFPRTTRHGTGL